ncbi:hypothetical protein Tco_0478756 [Tanacetum coccineum]
MGSVSVIVGDSNWKSGTRGAMVKHFDSTSLLFDFDKRGRVHGFRGSSASIISFSGKLVLIGFVIINWGIEFLDLSKQILNAQTEAQKPENLKNEDVGGWTSFTHGPENSSVTYEKVIQIKQRKQAARYRQKSYADLKHKPMELQVED